MSAEQSTEMYSNPRVDESDIRARADEGVVSPDYVKIAWLACVFALGTVGSAVYFSLSGVLVFLVFTATTLCLGHSLGSHRLMIHRSYSAPRWMEYGLVHLGVLVGLSGPLSLLKAHDLRDWAQRQARCHDFYSHQQPWYRDLWWQLCCGLTLENAPTFRVEARLANDPVYRFMEKTWLLQQLPWAMMLFYFGGMPWVCWGMGSRVLVSVLGHWLIGRLAHRVGDGEWHVIGASVQGRNVPWTALLTMGENWHNNHHAFPGSAKLGLSDGQWDPGWWVLSGLERLGLVSELVLPDDLPHRPELRQLGASVVPGSFLRTTSV